MIMEIVTDDTEVPTMIRRELMDCAVKTGIDYHWLCGIWVNGFRAKQAGPTGTFPEDSPLQPDDHGELRVALGVDWVRRKVHLDFGQSITWALLTGDQCRQFASALNATAQALDQRSLDN